MRAEVRPIMSKTLITCVLILLFLPSSASITVMVNPASVRSFRLGGLALGDIETAFFLDKGGSNAAFSGAIGTVLLRRFHVIIIDYKRQRLILEGRDSLP